MRSGVVRRLSVCPQYTYTESSPAIPHGSEIRWLCLIDGAQNLFSRIYKILINYYIVNDLVIQPGSFPSILHGSEI